MKNDILQSIDGSNNIQVVTNNFENNITQISSILAEALPKISGIIDKSDEGQGFDAIPYEIRDKIDYNQINAFKQIIDEYGEFGSQIDSIYDEYDNNSPGFKNKIFRYFSSKYLLLKTKLCTENKEVLGLALIKANSDKIMMDIFEQLKKDLVSCDNLKLKIEEVDACSLAVVCHAFISCKILEKPQSVN